MKGRAQLTSELSSPLPEPASLRASTNNEQCPLEVSWQMENI